MLKFSYDESLAMGRFEVRTNDRGNWQPLISTDDGENNPHDENGINTFTGYGGENVLTFHEMGMQDGSIDFVVVHSMVDSPAKVAQKRIKFDPRDRYELTATRYHVLNEAIATLLAEVCAYDPLEEAA